jgi:hypothetical protein
MNRKPWLLIAALLLTSAFAAATCNTVTVADTLYDDNGNLLNGTVTIVNTMTITGADGCVVPAYTSKKATVTAGVLSVGLVPNTGSTPTGTYYTAEYHVSSKYFTENWTVPASGPSNLAAVRALSPPVPSIMISASQISGAVAVANSLAGFSVRIANNFSGGDVGAKVNAADTDLGASAGDIWVFGGGAIATQMVLSDNHHLKLYGGTYTNALGDRTPILRMKDNTSFSCSQKQGCIVQESSNAANTNQVIVCAYYAGASCTSLAGTATNIHVHWIHFQGANPNNGTSLIDSVSLGNCINCSVKDNWFDTIKSSHILVGGTSGSGNRAKNFDVSGNIVSGEQNCSICVINGENVLIHRNFGSAHGNGAAAVIDIEPNSVTDYAQHIDIADNIFEESAAANSVYCVTIQNGPFVNMGEIKVHDNECSGGPYSSWGGNANGTFKLINCFTTGPGTVNSMSDIEIYNNVCRLSSSSGIVMVGTNRGYIGGNTLQCVGDVAINLAGSVTNTVVERNRVLSVSSPNSCGQNAKSAYLSSIVGETGSSNANNIFRGNIGTATVLNGTGSKAPTATLPDGSGEAFHVPVGLNGGGSGRRSDDRAGCSHTLAHRLFRRLVHTFLEYLLLEGARGQHGGWNGRTFERSDCRGRRRELQDVAVDKSPRGCELQRLSIALNEHRAAHCNR